MIDNKQAVTEMYLCRELAIKHYEDNFKPPLFNSKEEKDSWWTLHHMNIVTIHKVPAALVLSYPNLKVETLTHLWNGYAYGTIMMRNKTVIDRWFESVIKQLMSSFKDLTRKDGVRYTL